MHVVSLYHYKMAPISYRPWLISTIMLTQSSASNTMSVQSTSPSLRWVKPYLRSSILRFPQLSALKAFICLPGQGINYHAGTWHHPLVVLDEPAQFAMLVWEDGTREDCVEWPLPQPLIVTG